MRVYHMSWEYQEFQQENKRVKRRQEEFNVSD